MLILHFQHGGVQLHLQPAEAEALAAIVKNADRRLCTQSQARIVDEISASLEKRNPGAYFSTSLGKLFIDTDAKKE